MDIVKSLKKVRRAVAGFSLATLVASFFAIGVAQAQTFPDVNPDDWFYNYVEDLVALGVVNGSMESYRPAENTNRAEMAKLVVEAFGLELETPDTPTFKDVPENAWYYSYVETAAANGVVGGYKDSEGTLTGYYGPADFVTRDQAAKMIVLGAPLTTNTSCGPSFSDVGVTSWSYDYVETLYAWSVIDGYADGSYGPANNINRAEVAKLVSNGMNPVLRPCGGFNLVSAEATSATTVEACFSQDYDETSAMMAENYMIEDLDGNALDVTDVEASSDPMCVVLSTADQEQGLSYDLTASDVMSVDSMALEADMTSFTGYTPGATAEGDVTVELSSSTPAGVTLPKYATSVPVAKWVFGAGDEDAVINSVVVHKYGVSTLPSDHGVYLYEGNNRLTAAKSVNSTTNVATFNNLKLSLPANTTRTLTLRLDVGNVAATGEVGFELEDADAVDADAGTVFGSFPLQGDMFGLSTTAVGSVTIEKNGTVTDAQVGEKGATVAKFKVTAATENASLEQLGLYLSGTINTADVENLKLYVSGETDPVAEVAGVNSKDVAQFTLADPVLIEKGNTKSFWVTAEFNTGRTGDTLLIYIDETTDVVAIGDTYGFGMQVVATSYDGSTCTTSTPTECNAMTLEGGDVTISGSSITNRNISVNQKDVAIMKFTIAAATPVTFDTFTMYLDTDSEAGDDDAGLLNSSGTANFTDIKVKEVGGSHVWGPIDADVLKTSNTFTTAIGTGNDDSPGYYKFTDDFYLDAGESAEFEVTVDVANQSALANHTIRAAVYIDSSNPVMKDVNNKTLTNAGSLVPTSTYVGDEFTVKSNSLTIGRTTDVTSHTVVVGSTNESLASFSFTGGDAGTTTVTSMTLTCLINADAIDDAAFLVGSDTDGAATTYYNEEILGMNIYDGSVDDANKINSSQKACSTSGTVTFDNLGWDITAGGTKTLIVTGDFANNSAYDGDELKVDFHDVSADITAEDSDGNALSGSAITTDDQNGYTTDSATLYTQLTVSAGGTLAADIPSSTPPTEIVVGGSSDNVFSYVRLTGTSESFLVNKMTLKNAYSSTAGDYDDAVNSVKVTYYTDEAMTESETVTCSPSATAGYYNCSGMNMLVPNPDLTGVQDYADLMITANINTITSSNQGNVVGDLPAFTLSLGGDFEATGVDSGKKIEEAGTYDLSITDVTGTPTDSTLDLNTTISSATTTAVVADAAISSNIAVGDIICIDVDDAVGSCTGLEQMYVSAKSGSTLTVVRGVNGTTAASSYTAAGGDDSIWKYSSLLSTNAMVVRKTDLTASAAADSRTGSTSGTEQVLTFSATADPAADVYIRQGKVYPVADNTGWTNSGMAADAAETTTTVSGGGAVLLTEDGASATTDYTYYDTSSTSEFGAYTRVSFWIRSDAAKAAGDLEFITDTETDLNNSSANEGNVAIPALTANQWMFVDSAISNNAAARYFGINVAANPDNSAAIIVDEIRFYDDKLNVDLKLNENWAAVTPTAAYLKQNGTTVASGYVDLDGVVSSRTGQIIFTPVGTYGSVMINGTDTFVVEMDTATAIQDDSTATEKLTATVDMGAYGTAGDVLWYDGVGTVNFFGINATDKFSTVSSY